MSQQDLFGIAVLREDDSCVVSVRGELDLAGCPDLEAALLEVEQSDAAQILVDLRELTFIDCSGLGVLTKAAARAGSNGNRLGITSPRDQVASILRLTELDKRLPMQAPNGRPSATHS